MFDPQVRFCEKCGRREAPLPTPTEEGKSDDASPPPSKGGRVLRLKLRKNLSNATLRQELFKGGTEWGDSHR